MKVIEVRNLTKRFKDLVAVNNVSLTVEAGEIYGFVRLNGAGKTTTIRLLLGMLKPTSGAVFLFGQNISKSFKRWNEVGYLVETTHAYPNLTVRENLTVYYHLRQLKNKGIIDEIIARLKLVEYQNIRAKHLSLGNLQRLGLAKALMHQPKLLLLDEPMNGLDPAGIIEMREMFKALAREGATIFISSHILSELAKLATNIGVIHRGKLLRELNSAELEQQVMKKLIIETHDNTRTLAFLQQNGISASLNAKNTVEVCDESLINNPATICEALVNVGLTPRQLYVFEEDLEAFFIRIITTDEVKR